MSSQHIVFCRSPCAVRDCPLRREDRLQNLLRPGEAEELLRTTESGSHGRFVAASSTLLLLVCWAAGSSAAALPLLPADDQVQTRCCCPHVQVRKMLGKKAALSMSLGLLFYTYGSGGFVFGANSTEGSHQADGMLGGSTLQWRPCLAQSVLQHWRRGGHRLPKNRAVVSSHIPSWT